MHIGEIGQFFEIWVFPQTRVGLCIDGPCKTAKSLHTAPGTPAMHFPQVAAGSQSALYGPQPADSGVSGHNDGVLRGAGRTTTRPARRIVPVVPRAPWVSALTHSHTPTVGLQLLAEPQALPHHRRCALHVDALHADAEHATGTHSLKEIPTAKRNSRWEMFAAREFFPTVGIFPTRENFSYLSQSHPGKNFKRDKGVQ